MNKNQYIAPSIFVVNLVEADNVLLGMSDGTNASSSADVEVKLGSTSRPSYNVWDDDWSQ